MGAAMAKSISASVGKGGVNLPIDVKTIRDLLSAWANKAGLPAFGSGGIDQPTIHAISRFQSAELHRRAPDGRVDPGGATFAALLKLNRVAAAPAKPASGTPGVTYSSGVDPTVRLVSDYSIKVIEKALQAASVDAAVITSTLRHPAEQAAAMYKNAVKNLSAQFALYGATGDEVLKVYEKNQAQDAATVIGLMAAKIEELVARGKRVSLHVVTPASYASLNVIDIGVNSTRAAAGASFKLAELTKAFSKLAAEGYIKKFIDETAKTNSCWHLEIVPGAKPL